MSKSKTIWIINQYASTLDTGMGGRHFYLAQELARLGYNVYVIAGSYSHLLRYPKYFDQDYFIEEVEENFSFVWVRLPEYRHAHSKKRITNEFLFAKKIMGIKSSIGNKPDIIIQSSPALISYLGASILAKKYKVPFVFEVRDIWPLTLTEIGGYSKKHPFIRLLQWIEDKAYQTSDYVFSNLPNAIEHMEWRGLSTEKFFWIPNGVSLQEMHDKEPIDDAILALIPADKFVIGYTGTIGDANAMDYFIEAANLLKNEQGIHFVIVGEGKNKSVLMDKVRQYNLDNVSFINPVKKKQVQSVLDNFDACYIGWHKNFMYRFGIAANKIPEYMYSGKPVVHSFSGSSDFIQQQKAGLTVSAEDPQAIADAIYQLYSMDEEERVQIGARGRQFVIDNLTYEQLAKKIEDIIF